MIDYEKLHKKTLKGLQQLVTEGRITTGDAKRICADFIDESEDERIRKALLRCCDDWEKGQFGCMAKEDIPAIRVYLEKQKEQKSEIKYVYPSFKVGDTIKPKAYNESHRINKIKDDNYVLDNGFTFPIVGQDVWEIVEQKPAEWSEEDERVIQDAIALLTSEGHDEIVNRLVRLRPHKHWKPSEKQMYILDKFADGVINNDSLFVSNARAILRSLYYDLKKL